MDFLRLSDDKRALAKLVESDPYYQNMEEDAYDVVANYANAEKIVTKKEYYVDEKGKINMCTAIKELMKDSEVDGFIKALQTMGQNDDDIIAKLCEHFDITSEDAHERIAQLKL